MKFENIWKELNLQWERAHYLVVDCKTYKAVITNLHGLVEIANEKSLDQEYTESLEPGVIEHEIKNELERVGIYVQFLNFGETIDYEDIKLVKTIEHFLGG